MDRATFQQQLRQLSNQHGEIVGAFPTDPQIAIAPGVNDPNPIPIYRYVFTDGTYLDAKGTGGAGSTAEDFEIHGGTAMRQGAASTPTLRDTPQGLMRYNPDTNSLEPVKGGRTTAQPSTISAGTSQKYIVMQGPDGQLTQVPNPNYVDPVAQAAAAAAASRKPLSDTLAEKQADYQNAVAQLQWQLDQGLISTKQAEDAAAEHLTRVKAELDQQSAQALADRQAKNQADAATAQWNRELPFKQAEERRANASLQMQANQARANVLMQQAQQGQQMLDQGVKAGVAPSVDVVNAAYWHPWQRAMSIMNQGFRDGWLDPSLIGQPTPPQPQGAPVPQQSMGAPVPQQVTGAPVPPQPMGAPLPKTGGF